MQHTLDSVFAAALTSSDEKRVELADRLFCSVSEAYQRQVDDAWNAEIELRLKQLDEGKAELIPWEEVREDLLKRGLLQDRDAD